MVFANLLQQLLHDWFAKTEASFEIYIVIVIERISSRLHNTWLFVCHLQYFQINQIIHVVYQTTHKQKTTHSTKSSQSSSTACSARIMFTLINV